MYGLPSNSTADGVNNDDAIIQKKKEKTIGYERLCARQMKRIFNVIIYVRNGYRRNLNERSEEMVRAIGTSRCFLESKVETAMIFYSYTYIDKMQSINRPPTAAHTCKAFLRFLLSFAFVLNYKIYDYEYKVRETSSLAIFHLTLCAEQ